MNEFPASQPLHSELNRELMLVTIAIFLQVSLSALDTTIVGTALPTVVAALGGLQLYSWVFSAYMLTNTVATPIAGKLSDQLSRKRIYLVGIAGFVMASWLCGLAQNMIMLIIFRAFQGLAAGTMFAVSMGLIAILYPPVKRGRMQGMISSIWAIASMFGPLVGGFVVQHFSWRWVFYLNLPIGMVAWLFVKRNLHETTGAIPAVLPASRKVRIDYFGALALIGCVVSFLLAITDDSHTSFSWRMALLVLAFALLVIFIIIERRAPEPILPLALLRRSEIAAANLSAFITSIGMFGMILFAPLFVQGVLLGSPSQAGIVLIPISLGWAAGSMTSGHTVNRFGYRRLAVTGAAFMTIGLFLQAQIEATASLFHSAATCLIVGFGMGLVTTSVTVSVQNIVEPSKVGMATASTVFSRILGAAVGVSVLGAILSRRLIALLHDAKNLSHAASGMTISGLSEVRALLRPEARAKMSPETLAIFQKALEESLQNVFLVAAGIALLAVFIASRVSAQRPAAKLQHSEP
ncbi:MAG: MFS transporter [candidate division KSB1 bacterium]|nr:MFS transporter [candidate division KSB1 bacterium]MDZ7302059.1 MFS transporter [candidate division KSB1 bacterium]MDZ7311101.1 MFS transporter [candidate division KSB1 bacterium]